MPECATDLRPPPCSAGGGRGLGSRVGRRRRGCTLTIAEQPTRLVAQEDGSDGGPTDTHDSRDNEEACPSNFVGQQLAEPQRNQERIRKVDSRDAEGKDWDGRDSKVIDIGCIRAPEALHPIKFAVSSKKS